MCPPAVMLPGNTIDLMAGTLKLRGLRISTSQSVLRRCIQREVFCLLVMSIFSLMLHIIVYSMDILYLFGVILFFLLYFQEFLKT